MNHTTFLHWYRLLSCADTVYFRVDTCWGNVYTHQHIPLVCTSRCVTSALVALQHLRGRVAFTTCGALVRAKVQVRLHGRPRDATMLPQHVVLQFRTRGILTLAQHFSWHREKTSKRLIHRLFLLRTATCLTILDFSFRLVLWWWRVSTVAIVKIKINH